MVRGIADMYFHLTDAPDAFQRHSTNWHESFEFHPHEAPLDSWATKKVCYRASASSRSSGQFMDVIEPAMLWQSREVMQRRVSSAKGSNVSSFFLPKSPEQTNDHFEGGYQVERHKKEVDIRVMGVGKIMKGIAAVITTMMESVMGAMSPATMLRILAIAAIIATRQLLHAIVKGELRFPKFPDIPDLIPDIDWPDLSVSLPDFSKLKKLGKGFLKVMRGLGQVGKFLGKWGWKGLKLLGKGILKYYEIVGKMAWKGIKAIGKGMWKGAKFIGKYGMKGLKLLGKGLAKGAKLVGKYYEILGKRALRRLKMVGKGMWKGIKGGIKGIGKVAGYLFKDFGLKWKEFGPLAAIGSVFVNAGKGIAKIARTAWSGIKSIGKGIANVASTIGKAVASIGKGMWKVIKAPFQLLSFGLGSLDKAVKAMGRGIISGLDGAWNSALGKVGRTLLLLGAVGLAAGYLFGKEGKNDEGGNRAGAGPGHHGNAADFRADAKRRAAAREQAAHAEAQAEAAKRQKGSKASGIEDMIMHSKGKAGGAAAGAVAVGLGVGIASACPGAGEEPLPEGWEKHCSSEHSAWYYTNKFTKEVTWDAPLPEGWEKHWNFEYKNWYYFNKLNNEVTWVRPEVASPSAHNAGTVVVGAKPEAFDLSSEQRRLAPDVRPLAQSIHRRRPDPRRIPDSRNNPKPGAPHGDLQPFQPNPVPVVPTQGSLSDERKDQLDFENEVKGSDSGASNKHTGFVVTSMTRQTAMRYKESFWEEPSLKAEAQPMQKATKLEQKVQAHAEDQHSKQVSKQYSWLQVVSADAAAAASSFPRQRGQSRSVHNSSFLSQASEPSAENEATYRKERRELFPLYYLDHNGKAKDFIDPAALRPVYRKFALSISGVGTTFLQVAGAPCHEGLLAGRATGSSRAAS